MPAALKKDYGRALDLYIQGVQPAQIAHDLDIPIGTLQAQIHRGKWRSAKLELLQTLPERGVQWRNRAATLVNRLTDAAMNMPEARLRKLLRADVQSVRDLIATGMQVYGLDQPGSGTTVQIAVYNKTGYVKVEPTESAGSAGSPSKDSHDT